MKKIIGSCLVFILAFSFCVSAQDSVPMRNSLEAMGAKVEWVGGEAQAISVKKGILSMEFNVGSDKFKAMGKTYSLSDTLSVVNDITLIGKSDLYLIEQIELYAFSVLDAMQADENELHDLKAINTTAGDVTMCSWHRYPDSYKAGTDATTKYGTVWVFTLEEMLGWYAKNPSQDPLRYEQLIGLAPQSGYSHFSVFKVNPNDLYRPSADPEIDDTHAEINFRDNAPASHIEWYNDNIVSSYPLKYPWTRLGYTYDWAPNGTEYGLSEFIIKQNSTIKVENTYTTQEFFDYLSAHSAS